VRNLICLLCLSLCLPLQLVFADGMLGDAHAEFGMARAKGYSPAKEPAAYTLDDRQLLDFQYCESDSECVYAQNGCCDCANGGSEAAVSEQRLEEFKKQFRCQGVACSMRLAVPPCGSGVVSCVSNRCHYFKREEITFRHPSWESRPHLFSFAR